MNSALPAIRLQIVPAIASSQCSVQKVSSLGLDLVSLREVFFLFVQAHDSGCVKNSLLQFYSIS